MSATDELPDLWVAHDHPERPLAYGAWLCCCEPCAFALLAAAQQRPGLPIVLKTAMDRFVVSAATALDARWMGCFDRLLRMPDDWLREVFVGPGPDLQGVRRPKRKDSPPQPCETCDDAPDRATDGR